MDLQSVEKVLDDLRGYGSNIGRFQIWLSQTRLWRAAVMQSPTVSLVKCLIRNKVDMSSKDFITLTVKMNFNFVSFKTLDECDTLRSVIHCCYPAFGKTTLWSNNWDCAQFLQYHQRPLHTDGVLACRSE